MRDPDGPMLKDLPAEFRALLDYCQRIEFEAEPDYERIETMLLLVKERNNLGDTFDWPLRPAIVKEEVFPPHPAIE
jgi:hypothetical protein